MPPIYAVIPQNAKYERVHRACIIISIYCEQEKSKELSLLRLSNKYNITKVILVRPQLKMTYSFRIFSMMNFHFNLLRFNLFCSGSLIVDNYKKELSIFVIAPNTVIELNIKAFNDLLIRTKKHHNILDKNSSSVSPLSFIKFGARGNVQGFFKFK